MNPSRTIRLHASALSIASALLLTAPPASAEEAPAAPPAPTPAAPSGLMLADLRGEVTAVYGYGSWKDRLSRTADGVVVLGAKGAQGDGGLCGNPSAPLDLSGMTYLDVALAVGQNNEAPEVSVALNDADGTMANARIRIDQIAPGQPVWFRVPIASLCAATGEYGGKMAGFDVTKVAQWHVQGDWATKKPLQVVVIALRARR
ncbi:MAG: hypothetical protein QM691_08065 [Opitutaceae bacterium]